MKIKKTVLILFSLFLGTLGTHAANESEEPQLEQSFVFASKRKIYESLNEELFEQAQKIADQIAGELPSDSGRKPECYLSEHESGLTCYMLRSSMQEIPETDFLFSFVKGKNDPEGIAIQARRSNDISEIEQLLRNNMPRSNRWYAKTKLPMPLREITAYISRKLAEVQAGTMLEAHKEKYEYKLKLETIPCQGHTYRINVIEFIDGVPGKSFLLLQEVYDIGIVFMDGERRIHSAHFDTTEVEASANNTTQALYQAYGSEEAMEFASFKQKYLFPHFADLMKKHFGVEFAAQRQPSSEAQAGYFSWFFGR